MKKTSQKIIVIVSLLAVIALFALFLWDILIPYLRMEINNDVEGAKALLADRGALGFLTVVLVEALQMVVVFIPAEFIQISSGLSYPFYIALLLCDLGVCLGASIIFVLVRTFRFSADTKNVEKIEKLASESKKERSTVLLLYFLFIMPLIPFGAICYYASSTRIRYRRYILTVSTGVIPSIVTSNLMGAAARYFLRNDMPIPLLILIIVLLAAALFAALFIFLNKVYFKENDGTPDSVIYSAFFRVAKFLRGRRQRLHVDNELIKDLEPPYVLLCNHASFYDFYYVRCLIPKGNPAYVVNKHYIDLPVIRTLAKKAGFIPKKLFNVDFVTPRGIFRAVKGGYSVVVFPEGRLSLTGRTYPIVERSAAFYKKLGKDIVLAKITGAYFANPKWRKRFYRSDIYVSAVDVITKEEAKALSAEELNTRIESTLYDDASDAPVNVYHRKDMAKGLGNVLYRCADCGALYSTEGRGNDLVCTKCGAVHSLDENYLFRGEPRSISDYYDRIADMERARLDSVKLSAEVDTVIYSDNKPRKRRERGECAMTRESFTYRSDKTCFTVDMNDLPALPFSCGEEFELYYNDELYYFYPVKNRRQVVRWAMIADLIKEERNGNAEGE
ncbi:MAG: VTT domain-containing protein [Clostridia bacterium]|nr:VTT domain-containing protein [Clostridia bacterium]